MSFYDVAMTSCFPKVAQNNSDELFVKSISLMTPFCNQRINSRYSTIVACSRRSHLVTSLRLAVSYCSILSSAAKLTKIEDVLCLETMRGRGHNIL